MWICEIRGYNRFKWGEDWCSGRYSSEGPVFEGVQSEGAVKGGCACILVIPFLCVLCFGQCSKFGILWESQHSCTNGQNSLCPRISQWSKCHRSSHMQIETVPLLVFGDCVREAPVWEKPYTSGGTKFKPMDRACCFLLQLDKKRKRKKQKQKTLLHFTSQRMYSSHWVIARTFLTWSFPLWFGTESHFFESQPFILWCQNP